MRLLSILFVLLSLVSCTKEQYYMTYQADIEKAQDACQLNASILYYIYNIKRVTEKNGDITVTTSVVCIDNEAYDYEYVYPNKARK